MQKAVALVLGIMVIIGATHVIIPQVNGTAQKVQQGKFVETLIKAYAPIKEVERMDSKELGIALNENADYYTNAMLDFANLFTELPNYYSSLNAIEGDLKSLGFVFCYNGSIDNGTQWDYLLVHFACPIPVFGTIGSNWNYLYLMHNNTIQCIPLYTQSNIILNNIAALMEDNKLIFQLEGRETNYHPLQLFLGFLTVDEDESVTLLRVYTDIAISGIETDEGGKLPFDIPILINGSDDLLGNIHFNEYGAEIWLYDGLTAQVTQDRNIIIALSDVALEKGVSGIVIAHFEIFSDGILLQPLEHEDSSFSLTE